MKTTHLLIAAVSTATFALSPVGHADNQEAPDAPAAIKELKGLEANHDAIQSIIGNEKRKTTYGQLHIPVVINSMEEALEHLTRESVERIAELVDFEKQQVSVFAWRGSSDDQLKGYEKSGKITGIGVHYKQGNRGDIKTHSAIFAMPKGTKCRVKMEINLIQPQPAEGAEAEPRPEHGVTLKLSTEPRDAPPAE